jgi:hypothetical protein
MFVGRSLSLGEKKKDNRKTPQTAKEKSKNGTQIRELDAYNAFVHAFPANDSIMWLRFKFYDLIANHVAKRSVMREW